ncbi:MAG: hypothetical protein R3268_12880, partial [Acidiferrobacterales bacterium]|nr:hypothetical protein [Acidiferrobacterales bacterium]
RKRISSEGVEMRVLKGDVTKLQDAQVGEGFRLILDSGTFHDFGEQDRRAMGRSVDAIAGEDATVYLLVWPKRFRPLIRGASREEIEGAFPGWKITHTEPSGFVLPKPLEILLRPNEHWYRLRRK